ncbi:hypothetical protein Nepgr_012457 [Nepenthes gracilis]|uniref:Uncharacterized protein n=1 Tax=Nepenthes gracilis TaxID=150966 RepID=A0AAD3SHJ4_NEPGR|nr:hypothetical protein Nepgr_012457 [Nepenthes gracilis]
MPTQEHKRANPKTRAAFPKIASRRGQNNCYEQDVEASCNICRERSITKIWAVPNTPMEEETNVSTSRPWNPTDNYTILTRKDTANQEGHNQQQQPHISRNH